MYHSILHIANHWIWFEEKVQQHSSYGSPLHNHNPALPPILDIYTVSIAGQERDSPQLVAPVVVPAAGCPSDEDRQAALQPLKSLINGIVQNQNSYFNRSCGPGLWRRVFYLNANSQDQSCPGDWNVRTEMTVRGCAGAGISCQSAYSDEISSEYSKVCGRVIAIGVDSPDAFHRPPGQTI